MQLLARVLLNLATAASAFACAACLFWWGMLCNGEPFDRKGYVNPPALRAEWLGVPMWLATAVTAALPLWRAVAAIRRATDRDRRARREAFGQCPACGYDIRGSGLRCSECGELIGAPAAWHDPPAARLAAPPPAEGM